MKRKLFGVVLLLFFIQPEIKSQDITFIPHDTLLTGTLGNELIFDITATNISAQSQTLFMVRTLNDLPADWTSSLCFEFCAAPWVDSLESQTPFSPGESRTVSVHVFPLNYPGTGYIKIKAGTLRNPSNLINVNLTAIANPTSVGDGNPNLNDYSLSQNYPNPFNPTTKIKYVIPLADSPLLGGAGGGFVTLKVYDVLGNKVATLVSEYKSAGNYELDFDGGNLPSGIYLYRLTALNFSQTRKMILEK